VIGIVIYLTRTVNRARNYISLIGIGVLLLLGTIGRKI